MAHINEVFPKTEKLKKDIESLLKLINYYKYDDLSGVEMDEQDAEQLFLLDELKYIMAKLEEASDRIEYLLSPIKETSVLYHSYLLKLRRMIFHRQGSRMRRSGGYVD